MNDDGGGPTITQREHIERFLDLFAEVERQLKNRLRLRANDRTGVSAMIARYRNKNPRWSDSASALQLMADIRNLLTHNRNPIDGYPVAVTNRSLKKLEEIRTRLKNPETAASRYRKVVDTVAANDTLASVVTAAFEKGYSQFPIVTNERFGGLITENEVTRWLGRRARADGTQIDLTSVTVKTVLKEKDPYRQGIPIFLFACSDAPVEEVVGMFASRPMLEAVLLTASGHTTAEIEGIITQWDAARYADS